MLDWAARQAVDAGKKWLRLDAWANNTALQDYYRNATSNQSDCSASGIAVAAHSFNALQQPNSARGRD